MPQLSGCTIAFDLDGTLIDTAPDLAAALNAVLIRERLPPVPLEQVRHMVGRGARRAGARGGDDAAPGLDEQRVAGDGAQLVQQVAHRRLGDAQALGRRRDAATGSGFHKCQQALEVFHGAIINFQLLIYQPLMTFSLSSGNLQFIHRNP
mgnify:CR=1 FL=1